MKSSAIVAIICLIIGAAYLTIDTQSFNLKKQVNPPIYNKEISKRYGAYSKIAYCPHDKVQNWTCKDCQTYNTIVDLKIVYNAKRDVFGYVFYDTELKKIVLAWRGSIDGKNYVNDFQYAKIPYTCQGCEVHLGFYEGYRAVANEAYSAVQELFRKYPTAKVTVTGHSLGAALSTISAIQINKKSPNLVTEIHNFGCPRVGNAKLAEHIKHNFETLFRVIHDHDIFTHLPEQEQNFAHYPFEVLYDQNYTNYHICDDTGEDPTCSNSYAPNYNKKDHNLYFFPMDDSNC